MHSCASKRRRLFRRAPAPAPAGLGWTAGLIQDLLSSIAGVSTGQSLVAPAVVSGEAGHELLRFVALDIVKELSGPPTPQRGGGTPVMLDEDILTAHDVFEGVGTWHDIRLSSPTTPSPAGFTCSGQAAPSVLRHKFGV